jgi:hypothetical protein
MKSIQLIGLIFLFPTLFFGQTKAIITIQNNSAIARKEAVTAIKWENITTAFPEIDTANFVIINPNTKKQVPYQLEHLGQSTIQNVLIQIDVKPKSSLNLMLQKGKPNLFETKTYARYVPERKDDFAWENDKIAFRAYGKAIEKSNEDAYGFDVWVKRTKKMILNERYKTGNYHVDSGNGMDYYHVGYSLGAGNMAPYINDTIRYSANYHQYKVLDNGPLRSTFQLIYDTWEAGKIKIKVTKTISIDAGSQLNRIENVYTFDDNKPIPVVIGIIKRAEAGVISLNEQQGILAYWEPTFAQDGTTGVGSLFSNPTATMWIDKTQILAKTTVTNNSPIVYYTGACWDKAQEITNSKQWFDYLNNFQEQLKNPLTITIRQNKQ